MGLVVVVVVSAAAARAIVSVLYHPPSIARHHHKMEGTYVCNVLYHITLAASTDSLLKLFLTEIILHPP
jgi:hypothetical protein